MEIQTFFDRATSTLTYVVFDLDSRDAVIIDPVLEYDPLASVTSTHAVQQVADLAESEHLRVHWVLETHAHADHLSGSQYLRRRLDAPVAIGNRIVEVQETFARLLDLGSDFRTDGSQFDRLLGDREKVTAGTLEIEVLATPGHTPACVSYLVGGAVFTGDALFVEDYGTGRCDFPRGSAEDLYESVHGKLYALPDETRVFTCHDYQPGGRPLRWETTIARSKECNVQLRASTTRDEFVRFRHERDATLKQPRLLFPSLQVNIAGGKLPPPHPNGRRYFTIPLNAAAPTADDGTYA